MIQFPLLKLPFLALKISINQMNFVNILELSMTSSKFKRVIEKTKYHVDKISFDIHVISSVMRIYHFRGDVLGIHCDSGGGVMWHDRRLNGELVETGCRQDHFEKNKILILIPHISETEIEMLEKLIRHLFTFLKIQGRPFWFKSYLTVDVAQLSIWDRVKDLGSWKGVEIFIDEKEFAPYELRFFLEVVNSDNLKLCGKAPEGKYKFHIKNKSVYISDSSCIEFDIVSIDSNCKELLFENAEISSFALNRLIKQWIAGDLEKLEHIVFNMSDDTRMVGQILEGINSIPSSFTLDQVSKRVLMVNEFMDIKRAKDDRLATITLDTKSIGLYVWHPKHLAEVRRN